MNRIHHALALLACLVLLTGCQSSPLDVHYAMDSISFESYQTVKVKSLNNETNEKIQAVSNTIENHLKQKGYHISNEADLTVVYEIKLNEDSQLKIDQIPHRGNIATRTRLEAVYEASILVNAIDQRNQNVVWKAFTVKDIHDAERAGTDKTKMHQVIGEVLSSFPEKTSSGTSASY